jgi:preprotein translocase subunit SecG
MLMPVLAFSVPYWMTALLVALFLFVCVLLILAVLIQRPAGGGLSGAFGSGSGSGQTAFGAKTGDALTIATIAIFTVYLVFAVGPELRHATRKRCCRGTDGRRHGRVRCRRFHGSHR